MPILNSASWTEFLTKAPQAHLLQTAAWGEFKSGFGWQPVRLQVGLCGAQILFRQLPLGLTIAYIPKGPVCISAEADLDAFWVEVERVCRDHNAVFLKIEPDAWEGESEEPALPAGCIPSKPIQPRRTVLVDLSGDSQDWLGRMKQKTRYNVRLAEKKEIEVTLSDDVAAFHQMMTVTGERDGFGVHNLAYYTGAYRAFAGQGQVALLTAAYQGQPLAAIMAFAHGKMAYYFYGASTNAERNRMPTYLLQYRAMQWAAQQGCDYYDLWGIPDADESALEAEFSGREDGLWGVYRFKRGFGGIVARSVGAWDQVYRPQLYRLYQLYLRRRGSEE